MPLFFEFYSNTLFEAGTVLFDLRSVIFIRLTQFVLFVQANGPQTDTRLGTEHAENCALSTWHNRRRIRIFGSCARNPCYFFDVLSSLLF